MEPLSGTNGTAGKGSVQTIRVAWDYVDCAFMNTAPQWMLVERYEEERTTDLEQGKRPRARATHSQDWKKEWADFLVGTEVLVIFHDSHSVAGRLSIWQWDRYQTGCGAEFTATLHHVLPGERLGWRVGVTVRRILSNPGNVLREGDVVEFAWQHSDLLPAAAGRMYEGMEAHHTREFRVAFLDPFSNPYSGFVRVLFWQAQKDPRPDEKTSAR